MQAAVIGVSLSGSILDAASVILKPNIQPLTEGHSLRLCVGSRIQGGSYFAQLAGNLLGSLSVYAFPNQLSGPCISASAILNFPSSVRSEPRLCSGSVCSSFSRHSSALLKFVYR